MQNHQNTQENDMSAPAKEKVMMYAKAKGGQWPIVIDSCSIRELKTDPEVQYLVIPVKAKLGHKTQARLSNENNLEEKIRAFLISVGLIEEKEYSKRSDLKNSDEFDLFDGLEKYKGDNNKRIDSLRKYILADTEWLDSKDISDQVGFENKNRSAGPNTWKRRNKIFAISQKGKNLYPRYCLDEAFQPLDIVKEILDIFDNKKSGWSLAFWFGTGNSWLGGDKPKDVLNGDRDRLLRAAQAEKDGIQHG